jgi:hypothetical protein
MIRTGYVLVACCTLCLACVVISDSQYKASSAGFTGCLAEEIGIEHQSNVVWGGPGVSWVH